MSNPLYATHGYVDVILRTADDGQAIAESRSSKLPWANARDYYMNTAKDMGTDTCSMCKRPILPETSWVIPNWKDHRLCRYCAEAYNWGASNFDTNLVRTTDYDPDDWGEEEESHETA